MMIYCDVLLVLGLFCCFFFFKQKTAYEMRISDWSSDVCSSDLIGEGPHLGHIVAGATLRQYRDEGLGKGSFSEQPAQEIGDLEIGRASCRERVCQYV